jgi:hypothetical protein
VFLEKQRQKDYPGRADRVQNAGWQNAGPGPKADIRVTTRLEKMIQWVEIMLYYYYSMINDPLKSV